MLTALIIIGILLLFICIQLMMLILETLKINQQIQHFLQNSNKVNHQAPQANPSLDIAALFSLLKNNNAPVYQNSPAEKIAPQKDEQVQADSEIDLKQAKDDDRSVPMSEEAIMPEEPAVEMIDEPAADDADHDDLEEDDNSQDEYYEPPRPIEIETQATQPSIVLCPSCGRENSAFRKTCFHCETPLS